jgi:hypothetical protein
MLLETGETAGEEASVGGVDPELGRTESTGGLDELHLPSQYACLKSAVAKHPSGGVSIDEGLAAVPQGDLHCLTAVDAKRVLDVGHVELKTVIDRAGVGDLPLGADGPSEEVSLGIGEDVQALPERIRPVSGVNPGAPIATSLPGRPVVSSRLTTSSRFSSAVDEGIPRGNGVGVGLGLGVVGEGV